MYDSDMNAKPGSIQSDTTSITATPWPKVSYDDNMPLAGMCVIGLFLALLLAGGALVGIEVSWTTISCVLSMWFTIGLVTWYFTRHFLGMEWLLVEEGITGLKDGRLLHLIRWGELREIRDDEGAVALLRAERHGKIRIAAHTGPIREFRRRLDLEWKVRFPERWMECERKKHRECFRATFLWFPLMMFVPALLYYLIIWFFDFVPGIGEEEWKMRRLIFLFLACTLFLWGWYYFRGRKKFGDYITPASTAAPHYRRNA